MFGFFGLVFHHLPWTFLCLVNIFSGVGNFYHCTLLFNFLFFILTQIWSSSISEQGKSGISLQPLLPKWCSAISLREHQDLKSKLLIRTALPPWAQPFPRAQRQLQWFRHSPRRLINPEHQFCKVQASRRQILDVAHIHEVIFIFSACLFSWEQ